MVQSPYHICSHKNGYFCIVFLCRRLRVRSAVVLNFFFALFDSHQIEITLFTLYEMKILLGIGLRILTIIGSVDLFSQDRQ